MTTNTEVAVRERRPAQNLPAKIEYARELANSGLLPSAYRRNPANVLYAVEYGDMLGLSPMAAITGIHIIEGKPSASAGLISGLVRRAGHKLRVTGDSRSATCQIVRSDDPEYTFEVTWTARKGAEGNPSAEEAGLLGKAVWKQYPASMLKSRAITQCARDACEEALFGLHYTPEELGAEVTEEGEPVLGEIVPDAPANGNGHHAEPEVVTDQEWLASALERAASFKDPAEGLKVHAEIGEKIKAGQCEKADADQITETLKARHAELAEPVAGVVIPPLDPDDPWAAKVDELTTAEDVSAAQDEVREAVKAETMDLTHGQRVLAAIAAKSASLPGDVAA